MLKATATKNEANKMKVLSPLNNNEIMGSPTSHGNSAASNFFKKENREKDDEFDKMYSEYNKSIKANQMTNNFMLKENEKNNENSQIQSKSNYYNKYAANNNSNNINNNNTNDNEEKAKNQKEQPKPKEDVSEYKRLQDKLNLLERKILSIKSNYLYSKLITTKNRY